MLVEGTASAKAPRQVCIGFLGKGEVASVGGAGEKGCGACSVQAPQAHSKSFILK